MTKSPAWLKSLIANNLPWLVLAFLLFYTYANLILVPYSGFDFNVNTQVITNVFVSPAPENALYPGDRILQIGTTNLADYRQDPRAVLYKGVHPGDTVPITVVREGQTLTIPWSFPGFNIETLISRIVGLWWLAYFFWFFGTLTWLSVRPHDERWKLLIAFDYLTAAWLVSGEIAADQLMESQLIYSSLLWLTIPVYWHLHWVFPRSLGRLPAWVKWATYAFGFGMAALQWAGWLGVRTPYYALLLAGSGSLILLGIHAIFQPDQRFNLVLLGSTALLVFLPLAFINISVTVSANKWFIDLAFISLCLLPAAYTYVLFRRQPGGSERRANRALIGFTYGTLLLLFGILLGSLAQLLFDEPEEISLGVLLFMTAGVVVVIAYPPYTRWAERYLLGIPLPPTQLLEIYPERIITCLDEDSLVNLLCNEVMPSLFIRESALLYLDENGATRALYNDLPQDSKTPRNCVDTALLNQAGKYLPNIPGEANPTGFEWIRLVLSLSFGGRAVGVWLFGRRDPDDLYRAAEINILQALANQTAVALVNILQTRRLHNLYRFNIERQEEERKYLALELHDSVLGQMALLRMNLQQHGDTPLFEQAYQTAVAHIRDIINGLRPVMLNFGLASAIAELPETFPDQPEALAIAVELPESHQRYPPEVELHLYRIVQQALHNALVHAQASSIRVQGELQPGRILLVVEDDGIGYHNSRPLNLVGLLAKGHFGLAGMHERAALIGARIQISTPSSHGTRLQVTWEDGHRSDQTVDKTAQTR